MLADFHLLRPYWLLALLPAITLALLLYFYRREHSPWHNLIAAHLQQALLGGQRLIKKQPLALPVILLCWLLATLALAGPSWQKLPQPAFALKKATVLVLDLSTSMHATDMAPDRLTQMRFAALDFTTELSEGELALVAFAGDAFVISPLTPDHNNIRLLIPDLTPEIMPVQGSNLQAALAQADSILRQAGYPRGDIVVFTDGFDRHSLTDIQDTINNWPHRLSIMGFGTDAGAPVKLHTGELLKNASGAVVIPKLPQAQLASLARKSSGIYLQALSQADAVSQLASLPPLSALDTAQTDKEINGDQWFDSAIYLVWLLLPLALIARKYSGLLCIGAVLLLPRPANAIEWRDLYQTRQQQAEQDYRQGDFSSAQQKFADPLWQGNAAYRSGNFQEAEQAYRQATAVSPSADAFYNLGNSLAQQQRYEDAITAYQQALQLDENFDAAKQNADLVQQLLNQQKQQQKQQGDKSKQQDQQQSSDEQQQSSEQSDAQSGESEQQDGQQQEQQQEQQQAQADTAEHQKNAEQQAEDEQLSAQELETEQTKQQEKAVYEPWPNANTEEQQQLDNLLRKVQDDPAVLLRNKMYLEHLKRQQQRLPTGADEQW